MELFHTRISKDLTKLHTQCQELQQKQTLLQSEKQTVVENQSSSLKLIFIYVIE